MLGLSFEGRMGRVSYFNAGVLFYLGMALIVIGMAVLLPMLPNVLIAIPLFLLGLMLLVWGLRVTVLRLHDINRSGWWVLISLIPYLGALASLVISFIPGSTQDNDYGEKPRTGNWMVTAAVLAIGVLSLALMVPVTVSNYNTYRQRAVAAAAGRQAVATDPKTPPHAERYLKSPVAQKAYAEYAKEPHHKAFAVGGGRCRLARRPKLSESSGI